jgi:hypothetical protein
MKVCRCYTPHCRGFSYMAADPWKHYGEFLTVTALADVSNTEADIEDFLATMNREHPFDDFPASRFDPLERCGKWPARRGHA